MSFFRQRTGGKLDVIADVAGKRGGTTVLCAGPPSADKTLTAEVYAEVPGRPLYRAQRWGAVMLIDEADAGQPGQPASAGHRVRRGRPTRSRHTPPAPSAGEGLPPSS